MIPERIGTATEIRAGLAQIWEAVDRRVADISPTAFETCDGAWSIGQEFDHLIRSAEPVATALLLPRFGLRLAFGRPNRGGRDFDALAARYRERLAAGGRASGRFVPPPVGHDGLPALRRRWQRAGSRLVRRSRRWREEALDGALLPHPLLGKLTIREMLFFTVLHTRHHHERMRDKLDAPSRAAPSSGDS